MSVEESLIATPPANAGYSADVHIDLHIGGELIPVAQVGGGKIIFARPTTLPAASGVLVMTIDGQEQRWEVEIDTSPSPRRIIPAKFRGVSRDVGTNR